MMRNLLIEAQSRKPAPRQMHAQLLHQPAFTSDAVQIPNQQNAQQQFGINRGSSVLTVAVLEWFPHEIKADVFVDQPQQMILRNLIFQTEVVEQRFTPGVVSHHDQQASKHRNPAEHESF